jgi:hypothetical protein
MNNIKKGQIKATAFQKNPLTTDNMIGALFQNFIGGLKATKSASHLKFPKSHMGKLPAHLDGSVI